MEQRKRFIEDWLAGGAANLAALCRLYGISRKTGYKWVERFRAGGEPGLEDRSHAAHEQPRRTPESVERRVIEARRRHPSWGPKKLRAWLAERDPETAWPAASTIGEALKRAGLVRERKRLRRLADAAPSPLREPTASNDLWTIDYKGQFRTRDGTLCYPLTVVDAHSRRYLLDCAAHRGTTHAEAWSSLDRLFREARTAVADALGQRLSVRLDGRGTAESVERVVAEAGIAVERIEPGKPQQNGRHERLHRTLKAETARPPAGDRRGLQRRFDRFRREYNEQRPHEALGLRPPARAYEPAAREYPRQLADPEYPGHWERRRVRHDGGVKFQGEQYFLSEALAGELVGWVEVEEALWQIWFGPLEIALYDAAHRELWPLGAAACGPRGGR